MLAYCYCFVNSSFLCFIKFLRLTSEGDMVVVAYSMMIVAIPILELGYLEESCVHKSVGGEGSW